LRWLRGPASKPFSFKTIGLLASLGRRPASRGFSASNFSGFFAWWLWRTIYLSKLPGLDKKVRVAFDWTLDLLFRKDVCAVHDLPSRADFIAESTTSEWSELTVKPANSRSPSHSIKLTKKPRQLLRHYPEFH